MSKGERTKILNFMAQGRGEHAKVWSNLSSNDNISFFKSTSLLLSVNQINEEQSYDGQGRVYRFTTEAIVIVLGRGLNNMVKMRYVLKNLLLYCRVQITQSKYVVMVAKEWFTKIVYLMSPQAGLLLERGNISYIVKMHHFLKLLLNLLLSTNQII